MAYYTAFINAWNSVTQPPAGAHGAPITGGMTTQQKLNTVNSWTADGPAIPMLVPTYQIYNLIARTEFTALAPDLQQSVRDIISMGTVDASANTEVRKRMVFIFPNGTVTFAALANLASTFDTPQIPWWRANNYARPFDMGDVQAAGVS